MAEQRLLDEAIEAQRQVDAARKKHRNSFKESWVVVAKRSLKWRMAATPEPPETRDKNVVLYVRRG